MRRGLSVGAFVNVRGLEWLGVQVETVYSRRGAGLRSARQSGDIAIDYMDIPVMMRGSVTDPRRRFRFSLMGGWYYGVEVGCGLTEPPEDPEGAVCDAALPNRGSTDTGPVGALVFDVGLTGRYYFTVDLRYSRGLLTEWDEEGGGPSSRNFALMAGIGILLGI